jgi:hypothetical protein
MSFSVKFNWVLKIDPPADLTPGETYPFSKPGNRVFPIGTPIDLINEERQAVAKIRISEFTNDSEKTTGSFTVIKLYEGTEKETLSNYWKENI